MRWRIVIALMGLILVGCSPAAVRPETTTTVAPETTTTRPPSSEICLSGDLPFSGDGLIAALGGDEGDVSSISQIRWDKSTNCERITIVFGTESGAPATTLGPSAVSVIPYAGIVRIKLPAEVERSAVADTLLEGRLVRSVFVVRDEDQLVFIDIHAAEELPILARAFTTTSPATLVIDVIRADTSAVPVGVTTTDSAVVVSPTPGMAEYPIDVDGYVEPGLSSVQIQVVASDTVAIDRSLSIPGYKDTWQSFSSTIEEGPSGTTVLFVGTLDDDGRPLNGTFVSITIE